MTNHLAINVQCHLTVSSQVSQTVKSVSEFPTPLNYIHVPEVPLRTIQSIHIHEYDTGFRFHE